MPEPFYPSDLTNGEWEIIDPMLPLLEITREATAGRLAASSEYHLLPSR